MTIKEIQDEIVDEFSMFEDWMQRYEYIIDLGKALPLIDEQNNVFLIHFCINLLKNNLLFCFASLIFL